MDARTWLLIGCLAVAWWCLRGRSHSGHAHGGGGRRGVAVHEAGHVVIARRFGSASATISADGTRGHTRYDIDGSAVDEAVITLAGSIAAKKLTGHPCLDGSSDLADARRLLRGTGVSKAQARTQAARLVDANRGAIKRAADRGYRTGRM